MKRKLMAALAAGAMLGVLWTASPASAAGGNGESFCSFSGQPADDPSFPDNPGNNPGQQIRTIRDAIGMEPPWDNWTRPGPTYGFDPNSENPAVPTFCNPTLQPE